MEAIEQLRDELIQTSGARSDLLKWKLVIVAGLGTVALGLQGSVGVHLIVLGGIPLACLYVDLLCRHLSLRIHVIGAFLRSANVPKTQSSELLWQKEFWKSYEAFAQRSRDAFGLEDVALWLSSIALSIGVAIAGLIPALGADFFTTIALFTAGVVGVVGSLLTQWFWVVQAARLNRPEGQTGPVG